MIDGAAVIPLRRIPDERGTVFHMMKATDPGFAGFGEIYFSSVYRGIVKGWHRHRDMTLNYACVWGRVKVVLFDPRDWSSTRGEFVEVFLGPDDYSLVTIPPGVWNGFKGMDEVSVVANCCSHAHDPSRSERLDPYDNEIPYSWAARHH